MKRRQILQAVPALAAVTLLPSIAWAEEHKLELPPTLKMEDVQDSYKPSHSSLRGYWQPYGDEVFILTQLTAVYRPEWWSPSVPTWGPDNDADFLTYFKEKVARDYEESRLFFERHGVGWVRAHTTGMVQTPIKGWERIRGVWHLQVYEPRKSQYTEEERSLIEAAEIQWKVRA